MSVKLFLCLTLALAITACAPHTRSTGSHRTDTRPAFIHNPSPDGRMGGVGIARVHIRGPQAQRQLAISNAIDELARQKGTQVQSWQATHTSGSQESATTQMETVSIQTTSGETIRAVIRQIWEDPATKELYVWMVSQ